MEDVLQVYKRPYDPLRPVVCMDETSKQLIGETRLPVDVAPGRPRRVDYEYERKGVADLFMFFEPLRGWRRVWITPQRRKVEWAWCVKQLLDEHYPQAERLVLVCDNLNASTAGSTKWRCCGRKSDRGRIIETEPKRRCAGGSRRRTPGSSWRSCIRCSSTPILMDFRCRGTYQKSCDSRRVRLNPDK